MRLGFRGEPEFPNRTREILRLTLLGQRQHIERKGIAGEMQLAFAAKHIVSEIHHVHIHFKREIYSAGLHGHCAGLEEKHIVESAAGCASTGLLKFRSHARETNAFGEQLRHGQMHLPQAQCQ